MQGALKEGHCTSEEEQGQEGLKGEEAERQGEGKRDWPGAEDILIVI